MNTQKTDVVELGAELPLSNEPRIADCETCLGKRTHGAPRRAVVAGYGCPVQKP